MPFTPFHIGLGVLAKAPKPQRFSLTAFVLVQVLIDFEVLFNIVNNGPRLHGFFHSFIGTSIIALLITAGMYLAGIYIKDEESEKGLSLLVIFYSALIGSLSHTFLDCIMHTDITPFEPFTDYNPWLELITILNLHILLVLFGLMGAIGLLIRHFLFNEKL